jgi:hypothetical protein
MPHKFKIGAIVYYRPKGRMLNTARGTYTVIGRMPAGSDQQPEAPPVLLEAPNPTVECKCGNCGAVLMRGDKSEACPLMILCISCGSYNSTKA